MTYSGVQSGWLGMSAMHGALGKGDIGASGREEGEGQTPGWRQWQGRLLWALTGLRKDSGLIRMAMGSIPAVFKWIKMQDFKPPDG